MGLKKKTLTVAINVDTIFILQWASRQRYNSFTGGRDPPLAQCGLQKKIVETLNNVGHHQAYRIEVVDTLWGVLPCSMSQDDFFKPTLCKGGVPATHVDHGYISQIVRLTRFCYPVSQGRSSRTTFPQIFLFFFQQKQETFPKFGNLTEGRIFGTLRSPIFGGKKEKNKTWKYKKNARKKNLEIQNASIRKALINSRRASGSY